MKISMAGKMGDLVYALPVIKALARQHGPITLVTSALCYQLVPLLWEQPYIKDVEMDYTRSYKIENGSIIPWAILTPEEGLNLSPQPSLYRMASPPSWTMGYAEIAGIKELIPQDCVAFPTLWNHRQWYWEHTVTREDTKEWKPPPTCIIAPETESLKPIPLWTWGRIIEELSNYFRVIVIGTQMTKIPFSSSRNGLPLYIDLRGLTTVSTIARLLAEAHVAICANSLPWHLARHAGTPTFCFQDQHVERCVPIDTPYHFFTSERWEEMVKWAISLAPENTPRTTLWPKELVDAIAHG